ncbi:MAG: hypothetical protein WCP18_02570 [bacterium]
MNKTIKYLTFSFFSFFVLMQSAIAGTIANLKNATPDPIVGNADLNKMIGLAVSMVVGFVGVFFLVIVIYGGFMWATAQGDAGKVGKAKAAITNGIIGLAITLGSYLIVNYVLTGFGVK